MKKIPLYISWFCDIYRCNWFEFSKEYQSMVGQPRKSSIFSVSWLTQVCIMYKSTFFLLWILWILIVYKHITIYWLQLDVWFLHFVVIFNSWNQRLESCFKFFNYMNMNMTPLINSDDNHVNNETFILSDCSTYLAWCPKPCVFHHLCSLGFILGRDLLPGSV